MNKLTALRKGIEDLGLDAVIVYSDVNQFYLTDFHFSDGVVLVTKNEAHLITDFRYYEAALNKAGGEFTVVMPGARREYIAEALKKESVKKLGFEGGFVSYAQHKALCEFYPDVEFVSIGNLFASLREIKSEEEIRRMQLAQDITDKAYAHLLTMLTPNMTEREVALELDYAMRKFGADSMAFTTIAVSGDASAIPHGTPRDVVLKKGFLTMDFGAKLDGYCSDMTRTVVIGKADEDMKKLYYTVLKAQEAALDFLRAGVDCGEADKIARDIIEAVPEYKGTFGHSLGHSIGLNVHEMPSLSTRGFGTKLYEGHVTSVEPGIYLFGKYGCRIEDMVAICKDGIHNFTHSPKELVEIL